jgi:SAM-dependent methyltransferase
MTDSDYRSLLRQATLDEDHFIQLTLQGKVRGQETPWRKIVVRPVLIKNKRYLQFSWFDAKQDTTKNYQGEAAEQQLDEALAIPFSSIHLRTSKDDLSVQLTKKGKAIIHRNQPPAKASIDLNHNRNKQQPLPLEQSVAMLQALGIVNSQGSLKPAMLDKYGQINEFLRLVEGTGMIEKLPEPIRIIDCGSGSAYLTFGIYHYLHNLRDLKTEVTGIDSNAHVVQKSNATRDELGYDDLNFVQSLIEEYRPEHAPNIVMALHACDTATDDAIVQAIQWDAQMLICAPCCHHDLNDKIDSDTMRPILRHGILRQRMADIITDSFRALALRIMGYRTDVIEFIDVEHTAKNLMIRAIKTHTPAEHALIKEYNQLKAFWQVTPYIETRLGEEFTKRISI